MRIDGAYLCGPRPPTVEDLEVVADFRRFLEGDRTVWDDRGLPHPPAPAVPAVPTWREEALRHVDRIDSLMRRMIEKKPGQTLLILCSGSAEAQAIAIAHGLETGAWRLFTAADNLAGLWEPMVIRASCWADTMRPSEAAQIRGAMNNRDAEIIDIPCPRAAQSREQAWASANNPDARCPCGHPWGIHDVDEYRGDGTEMCCVTGCRQAECPGLDRAKARAGAMCAGCLVKPLGHEGECYQ